MGAFIVHGSRDDPATPIDWEQVDIETLQRRQEAQRAAYMARSRLPDSTYRRVMEGRAIIDRLKRGEAPEDLPRPLPTSTPSPTFHPRFDEMIRALNSGTLDFATADRYIVELGNFDLDGDGVTIRQASR